MREQRPTEPNTWLYRENADGSRQWGRAVAMPDRSPLWHEATEAEYEQWQALHPEAEADDADEPADGDTRAPGE